MYLDEFQKSACMSDRSTCRWSSRDGSTRCWTTRSGMAILTRMLSKLYRNVILLTTIMLILWTTGCAPMRPGQMSTQQVDELKAKVGYIGVVGAHYTPDIYVKIPARNVAEGAKEGAKIPVQIAVGLLQGNCGDGGFCLLVLATGVALTPVGAFVGGVEGAISPDNTEMVNSREVKIKQSLIDLRMNEHIRDRFSSRLSNLQMFPSKILLSICPSEDSQKPDYRCMKTKGIDTVSEISVQALSLNGIGVVRPYLSVYLRAQVRLISTVDNKVLISKRYTCLSKGQRFEEWATQDAHKFREEVDRCYDVIAENAVTDLFINNTLLRLSRMNQ